MNSEMAAWRPGNRLAYHAWISFLGAYLSLHWDEVDWVGREYVPAAGPLLVVANHVHEADPWFVARALRRRVNFMAKRELFQYPISGWGLRAAGVFPVDRFGADAGAIRVAIRLLRGGAAVGMFPEGTRSRTASLQAPYPGAGYLAIKSGVPILPLGISGSEAFSLLRLPGARPVRVLVNVGKPFELLPPADLTPKQAAVWAGDELMNRIAALLPERYRGVYLKTAGPGTAPADVA